MKFINTPHERKSALLTAIIAVLLLLIFSLIGLRYFDPPIRYGIEVNFGTSSQGSGKVQPKELVAPPPLQATKASSSPPIEKAETKGIDPERSLHSCGEKRNKNTSQR